jgi:hypothetical protein
LDFAVVIKVVSGVCLPGLKIQVQCSYAAVAVGKTRPEGFFMGGGLFRPLGDALFVTSAFHLVYLLEKWLTSWIMWIVWFSFSCGQQTSSRKTLNYAIAIEVEVEAVTVE